MLSLQVTDATDELLSVAELLLRLCEGASCLRLTTAELQCCQGAAANGKREAPGMMLSLEWST